MIGLFFAILAPIGVIVWWEYERIRRAPRSFSKVLKRSLDAQSPAPLVLQAKESKRGFDKW